MEAEMNFEELTGKKLAILAWGEDEQGEDEAAVFTGIARWADGHLYLDHEGTPPYFQIPDDVLYRVKPVPDDLKDIFLDAEYYISLLIGPLPDDADPSEYIHTGLKWPEQVEDE
jgi:hypothetical protein